MAYETRDSDLPIPADVATLAGRITADHKAGHSGFYPPAHEHAGQNSDRQSVGLPGHCWACAVVGHVVAHPRLRVRRCPLHRQPLTASPPIRDNKGAWR